MTTTPLATIADALIEFILSLLRDPAAAEAFATDPEGSLSSAGLAGVCAADVRAVAPVIVDHPQVTERPATPTSGRNPATPEPDVVRQITTLTNTYQIDNRSTIVDQSVNQSIWTDGGDVMQVFDQEAVLATGDGSVAAGDDASIDNSDTDISTGDVNVGNTSSDLTVNDSFNDSSTHEDTDVDAAADDSFNDQSSDTDVDVDVDDSFTEETDVNVDTDVDIVAEDSDVDVDTQSSYEVIEDDVSVSYEPEDLDDEPLPDPEIEQS